MISPKSIPTARGPLVAWHRRAGGRMETVGGWEICVSHPAQEDPSADTGNLLLDWSHRSVTELGGPRVGELVNGLVGSDVAVRRMAAGRAGIICR